MPAISIHGRQWYYYIFLETNRNLVGLFTSTFSRSVAYVCAWQVMLGGYSMGTTFDVNGIWRILYHLHVLIEWGTTDYRKWFDEHVLGYLQDCLAPTV